MGFDHMLKTDRIKKKKKKKKEYYYYQDETVRD